MVKIEKLIMSKIPEDIAMGVSLYYEKYGAGKTQDYFRSRENSIDHGDTRCSMYFDDLHVYCGFNYFAVSALTYQSKGIIPPSSPSCITFDFRTNQ